MFHIGLTVFGLEFCCWHFTESDWVEMIKTILSQELPDKWSSHIQNEANPKIMISVLNIWRVKYVFIQYWLPGVESFFCQTGSHWKVTKGNLLFPKSFPLIGEYTQSAGFVLILQWRFRIWIDSFYITQSFSVNASWMLQQLYVLVRDHPDWSIHVSSEDVS